MTSRAIRIFLYWLLPGAIVVCFVLPLVVWAISCLLTSSYVAISAETAVLYALRTVVLALVCASCSVIASYPIAYVWWCSPDRTRRLLFVIVITPMCMGLLARNFSWIALLSNPNALVPQWLARVGVQQFLYTWTAVATVMSCIFVPLCYFILLQGFALVRPPLIEAARTLGASDRSLLVKLVLPITSRSILLAFAFTFALACGFFVTPRMIGGSKHPLLGNAILKYLVDLGDFASASALALWFALIAAIPAIPTLYFALRRRHRTIGV